MTSEEARKLGERHRERKAEKRNRNGYVRNQKELSKKLTEGHALKKLRMQLNPTMYIPYDRILSEDGYLGHHMREKISKRKQEIMDEMSKIMKIEKRFDCKL